MSASRRTFCAGSFPAMLGLTQLLSITDARAATSQPLQSFIAPFADMKVHENASTTIRPIADGQTAEGAHIEVHETQLNPGAEPHPPHRHKHEEFLLLMKGQIEVTVDGETSTLTPGSVGFWKSMSLHHLRNTGSEIAQYFIVGLGNDA